MLTLIRNFLSAYKVLSKTDEFQVFAGAAKALESCETLDAQVEAVGCLSTDECLTLIKAIQIVPESLKFIHREK